MPIKLKEQISHYGVVINGIEAANPSYDGGPREKSCHDDTVFH